MSGRTLALGKRLYAWYLKNTLREPEILAALRERTKKVPYAMMQITPEQGQLMALLVELMGARRALEIGTYTGYSALAVALALPDDGELVACDISDEYTKIAREFWEKAGVAHKIRLRLAPALDTLDRLIAAEQEGTFDFAFIDADKENYDNYYERCLTLLRPGGLIAIDNTLWGGDVADPKKQNASTRAIRAVVRKAHHDARVSMSLVPIGDGLLLARKR